jgi:hypothetical protein
LHRDSDLIRNPLHIRRSAPVTGIALFKERALNLL